MSKITTQDLSKAYSYEEYRDLIDRLYLEDKTTGTNHSEAYLHYTKLNVARMRRLDKTVTLNEDLLEILPSLPPMNWVVLTEGWCGDAAQNIPVLEKIAEAAEGKISLSYLLRDENLPIMDEYLTNGGRSIPKLIALHKETGEELGTWGPRPEPVQQMVMEFRKEPNGDYKQFVEVVQKWYAKDKTQAMQQEMVSLFKTWAQAENAVVE
ncbi:MAG TPA: thioredoxin family protein [Cytophagales bacterium]|nr:thioredoxin family protein [Cytophagales bacterium]HAA19477.1 thioredoxin family protein [Cytophagales bacterium]HAP59649.1 thioredoxin family protein [Cytophagales bacterium]